MTQISAKVIAHSKSAVNGKEVVTFELIYPRFIHGELMTHRMFSRNAASSRAIPVNKMLEQVRNDPATPTHWGKNQAGMQAKDELSFAEKTFAKSRWEHAANSAANWAEILHEDVSLHKQVVNRILEPFQWMKTIVTATEWENFYWLRNHEDAQPEIKRLAEVMLEDLEATRCMMMELDVGDWHTPYYGAGYWLKGQSEDSLEDALAISSSCCAQVSYRLLDDSIEKAHMVYKRLVESSPVHASPFEHQCTPMGYPQWSPESVDCDEGFVEGVTHMDRDCKFWSGNFQSWVQYRQLIPNNVKRG